MFSTHNVFIVRFNLIKVGKWIKSELKTTQISVEQVKPGFNISHNFSFPDVAAPRDQN